MRCAARRLVAGLTQRNVRWLSVPFCEELSTIDKTSLNRTSRGKRAADDLLDAVVIAVRRSLGDYKA